MAQVRQEIYDHKGLVKVTEIEVADQIQEEAIDKKENLLLEIYNQLETMQQELKELREQCFENKAIIDVILNPDKK